MARLLLEAGRFDQGVARLQEAVALDPATAVLWEKLGDALIAKGDAAGAVMAFERCYLALPLQFDVLHKMGDCLLRDNQPEAAMAAYQAVLTQSPGHLAAGQSVAEPRK